MTEPEISYTDHTPPPDRRKIVAVIGACFVLVLTAAVAMGASPAPSGAADPAATTAPGATTAPDASAKPNHVGGDRFGGFGFRGGGPAGFGGITITAINGSNLSLKTVDGWTRTITVTPTTELLKGGATIALSDLAVGDSIRFRQDRQTDGTFTISKVEVVLPTAAGTVTAVGTDSITIRTRDGSTATIHVDSSTTFNVSGNASAKLGDVAVGMRIVAEGEKRADGSLDATRVAAGDEGPGRWDGGKPGHAEPSAAPNASANPG
jgi:uncharacterized protein DUF5666